MENVGNLEIWKSGEIRKSGNVGKVGKVDISGKVQKSGKCGKCGKSENLPDLEICQIWRSARSGDLPDLEIRIGGSGRSVRSGGSLDRQV